MTQIAHINLILHCPFCQSLLANDERLAGRLAFCPSCENQFQMPARTDVPVAQPASAMSLARALPAIVRRVNVSGAFEVRGSAVPPSVALVDDVLTTGSTADALAQALKRAGCRRVEVWAVARATGAATA